MANKAGISLASSCCLWECFTGCLHIGWGFITGLMQESWIFSLASVTPLWDFVSVHSVSSASLLQHDYKFKQWAQSRLAKNSFKVEFAGLGLTKYLICFTFSYLIFKLWFKQYFKSILKLRYTVYCCKTLEEPKIFLEEKLESKICRNCYLV